MRLVSRMPTRKLHIHLLHANTLYLPENKKRNQESNKYRERERTEWNNTTEEMYRVIICSCTFLIVTVHFHRVFNLYQQSGFTARCHSIVIAESKLSDSACAIVEVFICAIRHVRAKKNESRNGSQYVRETKPNYQSRRKETENEITYFLRLLLIISYKWR